MNANRCLVCGSSNMRADRALSGRLVCNSCGTPYGVRKFGKIKQNKLNFLSKNKKQTFFIFLLIVTFIFIII